MRILVACEESQAVTIELRRLGHEAYSCDLQECSGGHPEWHIQGDALQLIDDACLVFATQDGHTHTHTRWDMMIAHPPCTYLSNAGAARLYKRIDGESYVKLSRLMEGLDAKDFFMALMNANIPKIAIENPIPSGVYRLPKYTQVIQPYEFGHPFSKKTCLWLKGLAKLKPTDVVTENIVSYVSGGSKDAHGNPRKNKGTTIRSAKIRSKTFPGIAKAMAEQWAGDIRGDQNAEL